MLYAVCQETYIAIVVLIWNILLYTKCEYFREGWNFQYEFKGFDMANGITMYYFLGGDILIWETCNSLRLN